MAARPGDDRQLLVVDRKFGPGGRKVCVVPGNLAWNRTADDVVRLLDEDNIAKARLAIPASEAVAAFGKPKAVGGGWFGKRTSQF